MNQSTIPSSGGGPLQLTADQERRAKALHQQCLIADLVSQHPGGANIFDGYDPVDLAKRLERLAPGLLGASQAMFIPYQLALEGVSHEIERWWRLSGITLGALHIPMGNSDALSGPLKGFAELADGLRRLPWIRLVTTAAAIRQAKKDRVIALYGYWQPIYGLSNDIESIDRAYDQGLRALLLTYNRMDYVGTGCTERCDAGLSMYGLDVVERCNRLGIIVDTSHSGRQTTLDACKYSTQPVMANHSCAEGVYPHARGKSDCELKAIAATGGVIGVVAVPFFLTDDPNPSVSHMLDHIDYIAATVGWQHVAIGTDWPLQGPKQVIAASLGGAKREIGFRPQDALQETQTLAGFDDSRDMINITRGLVQRGYSDEQIAGILGENFLRVFEVVCG